MMNPAALTAGIVAALIALRLAAELWLSRLNARHVRQNAGQVPEAFRHVIDPATYDRSTEYTLAKSRFGAVANIWSTVVLLVILFSGLLPAAFMAFAVRTGHSAWAMAAFLCVTGVVLTLPTLPLDWYAQFRLEAKFGFNTTTLRTWWLDRLKGLLLTVGLGYPLLVLVLKVVEWSGSSWWFWAWTTVLAFQLLTLVLAPVLIMPLFNKFTPLPEGNLRERLLNLANRTRFAARSIQVMDGSRRSRHSNAFFTGFGRFRRIVLFDTLIEQLTEPELEAVLAHEIGHYKKKHIPRMLVLSAVMSLAGFYAVSVLARQDWFYRAFGFDPGNITPALLLFGLLSGVITFWFSPLAHWWLRRHEYQADAFAKEVMNGPQSLIGALRKLNEKNLSNLTPHPWYSGFYYSHPTLLEREQALVT
jgi:STE24 endopeptidase